MQRQKDHLETATHSLSLDKNKSNETIQRRQIPVLYVEPLKRGQLMKTKLLGVNFDTFFF